jgi:short-subunit dehydrogenase
MMPTLNLNDCKGQWALVTGASSGIGREFCLQLGRAGLNVVAVARRAALLDELAVHLRETHGVRCLAVAQDLGERGAAARVKSIVAAEGIKIRLLINNAAYGPWGPFERTSAETYEALIHLVVATPVSMCLHFLPDLTSFPSSAIVNLSSPAALQPVPYKAVYSAAKIALHNFSLALYAEWEVRGVLVQTLVPGPTKSELDEKGGAYKSAIPEERRPPAEVVEASLRHLAKGDVFVTTAKGTYKQRFFSGMFPARVVVRKVAAMFRPPGRAD